MLAARRWRVVDSFRDCAIASQLPKTSGSGHKFLRCSTRLFAFQPHDAESPPAKHGSLPSFSPPLHQSRIATLHLLAVGGVGGRVAGSRFGHVMEGIPRGEAESPKAMPWQGCVWRTSHGDASSLRRNPKRARRFNSANAEYARERCPKRASRPEAANTVGQCELLQYPIRKGIEVRDFDGLGCADVD